MKNMKSTKRSLFLSAMALLLCTSMLIGTTYAWFTESVSSVNNIITGGNLDVELKWSADGSTWKDVDANTNVFTSSLWEPGHTEVVYLKVSNVGDLALKYQLGVNVASETPAVNADGDQIWLSQYIKFGVVESGKVYAQGERAQAIADAQASAKLLKEGYSKSSTLYPTNTKKTTSKTVALVVYMPETVGNEANYVGEVAPKINLGINLIATQFTWENDSFGNDYDENAIYYDVLVSTVDELYAAVAAATGDIVIAVDGNLVLTKALSKSGLKSIKFVAWDDEATIDQATYNMHFNGAKVTFEGLNLTHGEKKAYGDGGQTSTAFAVWHANEVNYVDCTFARSVGTIHAPLHNFIRCTFNGVENPGNTKSEYPLYICDGQDYNVIDCTFNCTNRGAILFYNDGGSGVDTLNISGTKFLGDIIDDKTAVEIHNNSTTQVYNVNIKDVAVGERVINGLYRIKPSNVGEVNVSVDGVADSVSTNKGFEDALTNTTATEIIVSLENDVTYDVAAWANDAMGGTGTETIVINGNGHTITFNQTNSDWNNIVTNGAKLIINDAKLTNAGKNDGPWNRHDLNFACDVELNNVISDKALAFKANATLNTVTINDANTSDTYAIWIQPKGQTINIDGLTIDMLDCTDGRGIKIDNQYLAADDEKAVTLNIKNATFKTEEKSAILVKSTKGAIINAENLDISGVVADSTNAVWVDSATADYKDLVTVTGANKIVEP